MTPKHSKLASLLAAFCSLAMLVSVKAVDESIFNADTLFIEAEDVDFGHGKYVTDKKIGMNGPYEGGSYANLGTADDEGFDWHSGGNAGQTYRADTALPAGKPNGSAGSKRGTFDVTTWWTLGWNDADDWYNYTRDFPTPAKDYIVYGHLSSGGNAINIQVDQITSGAGQDDAAQVKKLLGFFTPGRPTAGWDSLELFPMTDDQGKLVTVKLGGKTTLRTTILPGSNSDQDYFAFVGASTTPSFLSQPSDAFVYAGAKVVFTASPGAPGTMKWQRNGVDVPNSDSATLTVDAATAADDGAKFKAFLTTSGSTLASSEATLNVATLSSGFAPGLVRWDAYRDASGVPDAIADDPRYPKTPSETKILSSFESPVNIYENFYGVLTGVFVPQTSGNYVFFIAADDNASLYLSTDDTAANKKKIAAESAWSNNRQWITSGGNSTLEDKRSDTFSGTEWPTGGAITLTANKRYYLELVYKEGGGGDNGSVTVIKAGDADPASGTPTVLTGGLIGASVKPDKGDPQIIQQPVFPTQLVQGKNYKFSVVANVAPTGFNFAPFYNWQKGTTSIGSGSSIVINDAKASDAGTYRVVISAASGKSVTSVEAVLNFVPDTEGPKIEAVGAVKKGADIELGVSFDEPAVAAAAGTASSYTLSKGTIKSARFVEATGGAVIVASGLAAGDTVTVTAKGIKDKIGNVTATTSKDAKVPAKLMTWVGVGGDELNVATGSTKFSDDVVARGEKDFDLLSGGSQHWTNYDEETFVYEEITGDFDKVVRVEYQDPVTQWSRAGLDAREALDEGKTKADNDAGYKFSQHFTIRVNPPAVTGWDGRTGNNTYEVIHRPVEGGAYSGYNAMFNVLNGGGGAPNYPNAWLRLKREGQKITAYLSNDGATYTAIGNVTYKDDPESPENEILADKLFVGMFWGPEFGNIGDVDARHASPNAVAKFRDYGDFGAKPPVTGGSITGVRINGANIVIDFTGTIQSGNSVTGPWTDVAGSGSVSVPASASAAFYRVKP